jgi:hypothetical protein
LDFGFGLSIQFLHFNPNPKAIIFLIKKLEAHGQSCSSNKAKGFAKKTLKSTTYDTQTISDSALLFTWPQSQLHFLRLNEDDIVGRVRINLGVLDDLDPTLRIFLGQTLALNPIGSLTPSPTTLINGEAGVSAPGTV